MESLINAINTSLWDGKISPLLATPFFLTLVVTVFIFGSNTIYTMYTSLVMITILRPHLELYNTKLVSIKAPAVKTLGVLYK